MGDGLERKGRQHPRYEVHALVDMTGSEVLLAHKIRNLSLGGLCLETPSVEEVGTTVDLVINFPELDGASVAMRGEVVWAVREEPMEMGIRYVDLDDGKREILMRFIARATAEK
jgi:hypothetical protein